MKNRMLVWSFSVMVSLAQTRFGSGELKGFTQSPSEHIVDRLNNSITVRRVSGTVVFEPDGSLLQGVLIETRGPGSATTIRSAKTNADGKFSLSGLKDGTYVFKATLNGYQSILGRIVVSKTAKATESIHLRLKPGA